MTRPRCLDPGRTYLITRRCTQRRFLLRPDPVVNNLLLYLLAVAADRHEIEVHGFAFLSNHYHLVLTETAKEVRLPEFMAWFNMHVAWLINDLRDRRENVWAPGSYNAVVLVDEAAVLDKLVYTICNPVSAGLVPRPEEWEGLVSLPWMVERGHREARHPERFLKQDLPSRTRLPLTRPPCFAERMSAERFRSLLQRRVEERAGELREQAGSFLGPEAVRGQDPDAYPRSLESRDGEPLLACGDAERRGQLLLDLKAFQDHHRDSLEAWRRGLRDVEFPVGTYGMRRFHNALCRRGPGVFALE